MASGVEDAKAKRHAHCRAQSAVGGDGIHLPAAC
jgi:hypothetical protein